MTVDVRSLNPCLARMRSKGVNRVKNPAKIPLQHWLLISDQTTPR
tara:strand:- start:418 stop:552 length:135 start_codon:yes stop_codon:yes gene_type:complete